jgi:1-pyrroline-5-carboxylate dehydrogenase
MATRSSRKVATDPIAERMAYFRARLLGRAWPNIVGGRQDVSGRAFEVLCPQDRSLIAARMVAAGPSAVAGGVAAATRAQVVWAGLRPAARQSLLAALGARLAARRLDLALALMFERGSTREEALAEADAASGYFSGPAEAFSEATRPCGVVGLIVQAGEPLKLQARMVAVALAACNGVVLRPHVQAGLTAALFMEAVGEAGLPDGLVNMLAGDEAAGLLAEQPGVDMIAMAGPLDLGLKWQRKAQNRPFLMRNKGRNAALVARGADLDQAAEVIAATAFHAAGAGISSLCHVVVEGEGALELAQKLKKQADGYRPGTIGEAGVRMSALADAGGTEKLERLAKTIRSKGKLVSGGEAGRPVIGMGLGADAAALRDEVFLPVLVIEQATSFAAGMARVQTGAAGNILAVFANKPADLRLARESARQGVVFLNPRELLCGVESLFETADFRRTRRVLGS